MIKYCLLYLSSIIFIHEFTYAGEPVLLQRDNGTPSGFQSTMPQGTEETAFLEPKAPCLIEEMRIYIGGSYKGADTIYIVDDPAEGAIPPTHWVWRYAIKAKFIYQHDGQAKWYTFKVTDFMPQGLRLGGYDRLVVQHRTKSNGPYFATDNSQSQPYGSYLMNPNENNSLGGPGRYYLASGDFFVRALVNYNLTAGTNFTTAPPKPFPNLPDVSVAAGLVSSQGKKIGNSLVTVADWDNDNDDDVAIGANFFKNNGNGTFTNVTSEINIPGGNQIFVDYDNDGDLDVFSVRGMGNDKLYRNDNGTFTDITSSSGIVNNAPTVSALWLDYNNDGRSDLFLANGRTESNGQEVYFQDKLFRNDGGGKFSDVTEESGIADAETSPYQDCWSASICDYNNDGRTDILVNTYRLAPDRLYKNNGDGTFTDVGEETGIRGNPTDAVGYFGHGMGSDWADIDNDGDMDVVIGNLGHPDWRGGFSNPSLIFLNSGAPNYVFRDATREAGLKFFEMNSGTVWADLDHDGFQDLWHSQYAYESAGSNGAPARLGRMYMGHGVANNTLQSFDDKTWEYGAYVHGAWGVVRFDYDNDGDMDLLVASQYDGVTLLRNDIPKSQSGNWITVRLKNQKTNENGLNSELYGSFISVYSGGIKITRHLPGTVNTARACQATNELHLGLGDMKGIADSIVLTLPNSTKKVFRNVKLNSKYVLTPETLTVSTVYIAPQLQEPSNGGYYKTAFKWQPVEGSTGYEVQYATSSDFSSGTETRNVQNSTELSVGLSANEVIFWRVRAQYGNNNSEWSAAWVCINGIAKPDGFPTLLEPSKKAVKVSLRPSLKWSQVGYKGGLSFVTDYKIQVSSKSDFSVLVWDTTVKETFQVKTVSLSGGTTYWWRVAAVNNGVQGEWSENGWYFTTLSLPSVSIGVEPTHEAINVDRRPIFKWLNSENAETYDLQISEQSDFTQVEVNNNSIGDTTKRITKNLKSGTHYWWRVRGVNEVGVGNWSEPKSFTTSGPNSVSDDKIRFSAEVYPNPTSDYVSLCIKSDKCSNVMISIVDIRGNEVVQSSTSEICDKEQTIRFEGKELPTGKYFVLIRSGNSFTELPFSIVR